MVLSQDDVSYYEYMDNSGFPSRLVVSNNNEIKNVYKEKDKEEIGDFDMVPLIDAFVKKHPDFSYRGAKGTFGPDRLQRSFRLSNIKISIWRQ